jgi:1-phosphatidylinositol-3-phosphate 5-kinase
MPDEKPNKRESNGSDWGILELNNASQEFNQEDIQETLAKSTGKHFSLKFEEGHCKFFVKIFFAEQFDALRKNFIKNDEQFIESLSRCIKWESRGGKSGSAFLKTKGRSPLV